MKAKRQSNMAGLILGVALLIVLAGCVQATETKAMFDKVDVGLFAAYLPEYQSLLSLLSGSKRNYTGAGRLFTTGRIGDKKVVVTMSGIGMTNAAMTTQSLVLLFKPKYIIMSGIAGGIDPSVRIGDVVVPKFYLNPQSQKFIRPLYENGQLTSYFADTALDFPNKFHTEPGKPSGTFGLTLPARPNCSLPAPSAGFLASLPSTTTVSATGFAIPIEVELLVEKKDTFRTPTPPSAFYIPASPRILAVAAKVLPSVKLANKAGDSSLPYQPTAHVVERGMSANTFLDNADYRKEVYGLYQPSCVEMEGHAVLHTCISNKVECAVVRSISDLAGGEPNQPGENEIGVFFGVAAYNTGQVASAIIKALKK